jgi:hypothetical protein
MHCRICRRFVIYEPLHISRAYTPRLHPFRTMGYAGTALTLFGRRQLCEYFFLCCFGLYFLATSLILVFDNNFDHPLRPIFVASMSSELTMCFVDI